MHLPQKLWDISEETERYEMPPSEHGMVSTLMNLHWLCLPAQDLDKTKQPNFPDRN